MKVSSKIYKGIEYVRLSELPLDQKEKISESLNGEMLIKILIDETIISNCIQYKDYDFWFENVYKKAVPVTVAKVERLAEAPNVVIALGKA